MPAYGFSTRAFPTRGAMAPMPACWASMCGKKKVLPLEEAVRRMTSLPAQKFNLRNRGLLREGMAADVVIFDENTVRDNATYEQPHAYSSGFEYVIVNGKMVVENGNHNGTRSGAVLYGPAASR